MRITAFAFIAGTLACCGAAADAQDAATEREIGRVARTFLKPLTGARTAALRPPTLDKKHAPSPAKTFTVFLAGLEETDELKPLLAFISAGSRWEIETQDSGTAIAKVVVGQPLPKRYEVTNKIIRIELRGYTKVRSTRIEGNRAKLILTDDSGKLSKQVEMVGEGKMWRWDRERSFSEDELEAHFERLKTLASGSTSPTKEARSGERSRSRTPLFQ